MMTNRHEFIVDFYTKGEVWQAIKPNDLVMLYTYPQTLDGRIPEIEEEFVNVFFLRVDKDEAYV